MIYLHVADGSNTDPWDALRHMPESGFGYQMVAVLESSGADMPPTGEYIVFNCELYVPPKAEELEYFCTSYDCFLKNVEDKNKLQKFTGYVNNQKQKRRIKVSLSNYQNATLIVSSTTAKLNMYQRASAYQKDHRILWTNMSVVKDTYLSPISEKTFFTSGLAVVGRFALPTPFPANYVWDINPQTGISLKAGTVRPAFGQAGGGVEIVLNSNSGKNSVKQPYQLLPSW